MSYTNVNATIDNSSLKCIWHENFFARFWSFDKCDWQFWTLKMYLPKKFLDFGRWKTAFFPSEMS